MVISVMEVTIIMSKIVSKIKSKKGMTLVELLCAITIMLLVSVGMVGAVTLSNKEFTTIMRQSYATQLHSTLSNLITNELRFTNSIVIDDKGNVESMFSTTYPIKQSLTSLVALDSDGKVTDGYGELAFGNSNTYNKILGSASYSYNMGAKVSIVYDQSNNYFTVSLDVGSKDNSIYSETFNVRALNLNSAGVVVK